MPDTIKIVDIDDSDRLRPVDKDQAALIAQSMEETGVVENPIVIRPVIGAEHPYKLTSGGHRLEAFRQLGLTDLEIGKHVVIRDQGELEARLSEVDENLARHELNALDRAFFMAERKRVYLEINRVHGRGGDRKSDRVKPETNSQSLGFEFSERFSANAAKRLRLGEETIRLALRIADKLDREAAALIRGSVIETNQNELLLFIEMPAAEQRRAAAAIHAGQAKTTAQARIAIGVAKPIKDDPQAKLLATLHDCWRRASSRTRDKFLRDIGAQLASLD